MYMNSTIIVAQAESGIFDTKLMMAIIAAKVSNFWIIFYFSSPYSSKDFYILDIPSDRPVNAYTIHDRIVSILFPPYDYIYLIIDVHKLYTYGCTKSTYWCILIGGGSY